jgi:alpha-L-fucosidase
MLGLAPDKNGLLPAADVARLKEFGERIHQIYGDNLALHGKFATDTAAAFDGDANTYWQAPASLLGNNAPPMLTVQFENPTTFDRTVTMERLNDGQHIAAYRIEVEENGRWREVAHAQAIGHKKIDIFPAVTASAVRLTLLDSNGPAQIREFQVYNGSTTY